VKTSAVPGPPPEAGYPGSDAGLTHRQVEVNLGGGGDEVKKRRSEEK
jgi:hypothetical protein